MTRLLQVLTNRKAFDLTAESDQFGQTVGDTGAKLGTSNSGRQGGNRTVCGLSALENALDAIGYIGKGVDLRTLLDALVARLDGQEDRFRYGGECRGYITA